MTYIMFRTNPFFCNLATPILLLFIRRCFDELQCRFQLGKFVLIGFPAAYVKDIIGYFLYSSLVYRERLTLYLPGLKKAN